MVRLGWSPLNCSFLELYGRIFGELATVSSTLPAAPVTGQPDRHAQPVFERAQQDCWRAFRGAEPEEQAQSQQAG